MKSSPAYRLLYQYAGFCFRLFYKVTIHDAGKIPGGKPLIFAANHQNALMDALAILFASNRPVHFLARADIFKSPFIAKLLTFLKMLPVYRLRDEVDIVEKNREIFEKTAVILSESKSLGILPEGSHTPYKHLQILKKGICRIAFEAARETDFTLDTQIIPVGLDYCDYNKQGSELVVVFGSPISVSQWYPLYRVNPNKAVTGLRDALQDAIKGLMIDIDNREEYDFIYRYSRWVAVHNPGAESADSYLRFQTTRNEVERLKLLLSETPAEYYNLKEEYAHLLSDSTAGRAKFNPPARNMRLFWVVIKSLITSLGLVLNFAPYLLARYYSEKIKDPQFRSSIKYGVSLVLFPLWFLIVLIISTLIGGIYFGLLTILVTIFSALFALRNPI